MIEKYEKYLDKINESLQRFFAQQQPYIFCKEGCAICCEKGEYPFSKLEFEYAAIGYNTLDKKYKDLVQEKIEKVKKDKANFKITGNDKKFMHECPFLIDKKCSIYKYRGLICRSYGLTYYTTGKDGKTNYNMPCCVDNGLNYSNVYDTKTGTISSKKWAKTKIETEPVSYNVGLDFLLNNNMTEEFELKFGEQKALIDWFL